MLLIINILKKVSIMKVVKNNQILPSKPLNICQLQRKNTLKALSYSCVIAKNML